MSIDSSSIAITIRKNYRLKKNVKGKVLKRNVKKEFKCGNFYHSKRFKLG